MLWFILIMVQRPRDGASLRCQRFTTPQQEFKPSAVIMTIITTGST